MLDIADSSGVAVGARLQQLLQSRLPLAKRHAAKVLAVGKQQIERIKDQIVGLALGDGCLQGRKVGRAVLIERDDFAIDQQIGQRACLLGDSPELVGPVQPFAGFQRGNAALHAKLDAVAVELHFVTPSLAAWRPVDQIAQLRRYEIRNGLCLFSLRLRRRWRSGFQLGPRRFRLCPRCFRRVAPV